MMLMDKINYQNEYYRLDDLFGNFTVDIFLKP